MKKESKTVMEILNVSYVERPHAILRFKNAGFNIDDINMIKVSPTHYNMYAIKNTI
jgi:hypothetical protein